MGVPYTFATQITNIPLSYLDVCFATPVTIGNTSVQLGNTITALGNLTLSNTILNGITFAATTANVTITSGKSLTFSNTAIFSGGDGSTYTFPSTSATIARTDAAQTFTGAQTFSSSISAGGAISATGALTFNGPLTVASSTGSAGQVLTSAGGASPPTWVTPVGGSLVITMVVVLGTTTTAAVNTQVVMTNASASTVTLPASPAAGDTVWSMFTNGRTDNVIARNGNPIMGLSEDMTVNIPNADVQLRYVNASLGWRIL